VRDTTCSTPPVRRDHVTLAALALALLVGACSRETNGTDSAATMTSAAGGDSGGMKGMPMSSMSGVEATDSMGGMGGMAGMSGTAGMMGDMNKRMQGMMQMSGDQMKSMLPAHRQMAANMLAAMNGEMRAMNMTSDAAWTALGDSIRQDLTRLPEMGGAELKAYMPAHHARLMRLMQTHQAMSGTMRK